MSSLIDTSLKKHFGGDRMKNVGKSGGIPLDEVRLKHLKDPVRAKFALEHSVEEFESDGDVDALLDTLRLVARAQGGLAGLARKTWVSRDLGGLYNAKNRVQTVI